MYADSTSVATQHSHKGRTAFMLASPDVTPDIRAFRNGGFVLPEKSSPMSTRAFVNQSIVLPKYTQKLQLQQQQQLDEEEEEVSLHDSPSQLSGAILLSAATSEGFEKMQNLPDDEEVASGAQLMSLHNVRIPLAALCSPCSAS